MQKMITVTIDTHLLSAQARETFTINEVEAVNEMLESGWYMEEWEFLNEEPDEDGKMSLIAVLNDDNMVSMDEDFDYEDLSAEEEDDEEETGKEDKEQ